MKRKIESWTIEELSQKRDRISFPEYQRQAHLWSEEKKALLIDSILRDIDIPKLYFNRTLDGSYEVVDGQQRLWAIWGFIEDDYQLHRGAKRQKYSELIAEERKHIAKYQLQVAVLENADDTYLRELFIRLQLGLLLITGEKLHAASGAMKKLTFELLPAQRWVKALGIPARRFAKETLCAQMAVNVFSIAKNKVFARTRYEDLQYFFQEYSAHTGEDKSIFSECESLMLLLMKELAAAFGDKAKMLTNRSYILSLFLMANALREEGQFAVADASRMANFALHFWRRLREEMKAGIKRRNDLLFQFQAQLSSAPGEKYQIERRHRSLMDSYRHFLGDGKLPGD
jgi:Protein of unknown function DUF262